MVNPLQDKIFLHLGARPREHDMKLAATVDGVILQGPMTSQHARRIADSGLPLLLQHDGKPELEGHFDPDDVWIWQQSRAVALMGRAQILGDPAVGSDASLRIAVDGARSFAARVRASDHREPVALFAIDSRWLAKPEPRHKLTSALQHVGAAVNVMLSNSADPLDSPAAVEGLVHLVSNVPMLGLIRCDHGALGSYAFGATGGSIGATPGNRHFVPPGSFGFANPDDPTPRVFLPRLHAWWRGSQLGVLDGDPLFNCECGVCSGRSLARFQNEDLAVEADLHSVICWMELMSELRRASPGHARSDLWLRWCLHASSALDELEDRRGIVQPPSKQLKAWLRVAGVTVF